MTAESSTATIERPTDVEVPVEAPAPELMLTIFSKNDCGICRSTEQAFEKRGVPFREINVEEDTEPRAEFDGLSPIDYVKTNFGLQMPAVAITDADGWVVDKWTGGRMDKWSETVTRFAEAGLLVPEGQRPTS
jgi:glutaredoxin